MNTDLSFITNEANQNLKRDLKFLLKAQIFLTVWLVISIQVVFTQSILLLIQQKKYEFS